MSQPTQLVHPCCDLTGHRCGCPGVPSHAELCQAAPTAPACTAAFPVPWADPKELGHSSPLHSPRLPHPALETATSPKLFVVEPQEQTQHQEGQRLSLDAAARQQDHDKS